MTEEDPNVALLKRLDLRNLGEVSDLFAQDCVWHHFNSQLPDLEGDYVGLEGLQAFLEKLGGVAGRRERRQASSDPRTGVEMTAHDIVLYGATGFVGKLVAERLAWHPEGNRFSWAIAGRNPDKLIALRTSLAGATKRRSAPGRRSCSPQRPLRLGHPVCHRATGTAGHKGCSRESALTPALALGLVLRERLAAAERGELMQFKGLAET